MATKKTTNKKEELFYPMENIFKEDYPSCCGIEVFTGISASGWEPFPKPKQYRWETDEQFRRRSLEWEEIEDDDGLTKEELFKSFLKKVDDRREARHVQLCFVKRHTGCKTGDMPAGFQDFLLENGWYTIDEFVNPNHGNLLCVMGKTFRRTNKSPENW